MFPDVDLSIPHDLEFLFPPSVFPEQDPILLREIYTPYFQWKPRFNAYRGEPGKLLKCYWHQDWPGARVKGMAEHFESWYVRFSLTAGQRSSFFAAINELSLETGELETVVRMIERHLLPLRLRVLRQVLNEAAVAVLGAANGTLWSEELTAYISTSFRLSLWDATLHALHGRIERVQSVCSFMKTFFYAGVFLLQTDGSGNVDVLTQPLTAEAYESLRKHPAISV